jgi:hypothetical protein
LDSAISKKRGKKGTIMNPLRHLKKDIPLFVFALALVSFGLSTSVQAVNPSPDGGYPGANTAEGDNALFSLTSGINNTAVGANALHDNTTGNYNVAVGSGALASNTTGDFNMAIGTQALTNNNASFNLAIGFRVGFMNTTGRHLTGIGAAALRNNTTGSFNTAIGADALRENTTSSYNTAMGADALSVNTTGSGNTGIGNAALAGNTGGSHNTAVGEATLVSNGGGSNNTAIGSRALLENGLEGVGNGNTAMGSDALLRLGDSPYGPGYGHNNTALGLQAGSYLMRGSGNVYIGESMFGDSSGDESNHTYIRNINTTSLSYGGAATVTVDLTTGLLGHLTSSRRYKKNIKPMDKASEALYQLKPVIFRYKKELAPTQSPAFGLIAEDVAEVNPNLVARNLEGQPESIHYEMVGAMLLNEFLKEHRKVQELETAAAQQAKEMQDLRAALKQQAAQIKKISAQLETSRPIQQVVVNR